MSFVVTKLMGGLGNQMFQYAAGRSLALRLDVPLKIDLSWFTFSAWGRLASLMFSDTARSYMLDEFPNIHTSVSTKQEIERFYTRRGLFDRLLLRTGKYRESYISEPHHSYWKGFEQLAAPACLFGYWQNEQYFKAIADTIRRDFTFPQLFSGAAEETAGRIRTSCNAVAVHIRRGDYVSNPRINKFHGLCSPEYYSCALKTVVKHINAMPELFLFTDDPIWVQEHFDTKGMSATVINFPNHTASPCHDMHLMSLCKHHIIANSSFSWWGAWLANKSGIVCAPKKWFAAHEHEISGIPAPGWVVL